MPDLTFVHDDGTLNGISRELSVVISGFRREVQRYVA